ncbi:MAG: RNA-binding protein [Leptospiraceae bacterium]|nr:RNA-binding protein [Leptospiraceae bacterium]MDW8305461.1 RNA-binding protein [Leptospiraceae bacterium]
MNIYVGNLPYRATEAQVEEVFSSFGEVSSVRIARDKETGRSRGFAFVTMGDRNEAEKAIQALHGSEFGGRKLVVNEALPRQRQQGESRRRSTRHRQWRKRLSLG